jgi:UDPglucose--hexose-1-phosphate uridylyltransferase
VGARFIQDLKSGNWEILAPRREKRPDQHVARRKPPCPFEVGNEGMSEEVLRVDDDKGNWVVRVVKNLYGVTDIHEVIVHSPQHDSSFSDLPIENVEMIFRVYQERFRALKSGGYPLIFHNHGERAGESLTHGHSQLAVVPYHYGLNSPKAGEPENIAFRTKSLICYCPTYSYYPYETWIQPQRLLGTFADASTDQIEELARTLQRVVTTLGVHREELPYNFYIYPGDRWYLRVVGRLKIDAGFEIGSGIQVNTVDPKDVVGFLS